MIFKRSEIAGLRLASRIILIALIGVAGLGMAASGQAPDQIPVNIPYEFVVAGKTLPSGTYRVNPLSNIDREALVLSSFESRATVMVLIPVSRSEVLEGAAGSHRGMSASGSSAGN
jgi:hypothetical protein